MQNAQTWENAGMKKMLCALTFAATLTACGPQETPNNLRIETENLGVVGVDFPATINASEPLKIAIRYSETCVQSDEKINLISRTATELKLGATAQYYRQDPSIACPAVYIEKTLIYTDSAMPTRTNPFQIIVNGKSYGTVTIK
ncbi:Lipoprotein [Deinococcus saxicola]|uniref:hypothetical protein n=1 Tax=Deinococcus saxicola TaxID=249406 RepID=UPI0039F098DF